MAYIRYKEVTKYFNFSKVIDSKDIPAYIKQYILEDEQVLVAYKTTRDHGVFTDKKIVLFDNVSMFGKYKQIYVIPYSSISVLSVGFGATGAEINLSLDCGYPLKLKFVNMKAVDKVRLRMLYTCINRIINDQKPPQDILEKLIKNDITLSVKEV